MLRRLVVLALLVSGSGLAAVGLSGPAAAAVTASHITTPSDGSHYLVTDANPATTITVSGGSNGTTGDHVDVRCYSNSHYAPTVASDVPVAPDGSFTTAISTALLYGTCVLRAVPTGLPVEAGTAAFTGPRVTGEWITSDKVVGGPNAGKTYDYYVAFQSNQAMNDYYSAGSGGLYDARLQYPDGYSSDFLWYGNASFRGNDTGRTNLQVDGRNSYTPYGAQHLFVENPGLPELTFSATRDAATGTTTIHEVDPIVVCPSNIYPATAASCPQFLSAGVRLERTIVADDGGRQVHVTDAWRSTDGQAHSISAHYDQWVQGSGSGDVGLELPWLSSSYLTSSAEVDYPGPSTAPASIFVHDDNAAPDGDTFVPRGAVTFDVAPQQVHRIHPNEFMLRDEGVVVPAGGVRLVRQDFVIGTTEAEVATKAAASRVRLDPRRPDALVRKGAAAYVGNDVYNTTAAGQAVTLRKSRGAKATFSAQVQNDGPLGDSFRVAGPGRRKGFSVAYFLGSRDITALVTHGGFPLTNLAPSQAQVIRLVVRVKATAKRGIRRSWPVTVTSSQGANRTDVVKAGVRVAK